MLTCLRSKFSRSLVAQHLLDTEDKTLVEGNHWHDNFWGDCYCPRCSGVVGLNMLGQLLMRVRTELKCQS